MPFLFLFLFSFAWSEIGTCGEPCRGSVVYGGDVSGTGGICFTSGAVFTRYDKLVSACHASGYEADYCICIAASYCIDYYMIRGSCSDIPFSSSSVVIPPSSSSVVIPPSFSSSLQISSSSSVECPSGEFDWDSVSAGFVEAFPAFALIFGVWCIIKLLRMVW